MATPLDAKQIVSFEELLMSQGILTREDLLEMVKVVDREMKRSKEGQLASDSLCSFLQGLRNRW